LQGVLSRETQRRIIKAAKALKADQGVQSTSFKEITEQAIDGANSGDLPVLPTKRLVVLEV
jgi:AcrR family transcriptional regulator